MQSDLTSMPPRAEQRATLLDRPLLAGVRLNWETVSWTVLLVVATILRLVDLGVRAMSHDESLHTLYAYYLYDTGKYEHNPMMHGPLRYHLTALAYFLFGDSDTTARLGPAILGIGVVAMAYFFRRYIGRTGALMAGILITISPSLLFHSRYIRDDIFIAFALMVWIYGAFRFLEAQPAQLARRWLFAVSLGMVFGILAMEAHFISGAILGLFFAGLAFWQAIKHRLFVAVIPFLLGCVFWYYFHKLHQDAIAVIGLGLAAVATLVLVWTAMGREQWRILRHSRSADLTVFMATLVLPFLSPFIQAIATTFGLSWTEIDYQNPNNTSTGVILTYIAVVLLLAAVSVAGAWHWLARRPADEEGGEPPALDFGAWVQHMVLFWVIAILFYTTFLTNTRNGLASGIVGSLGYWLAQQKVERGSQPWYYYILLAGLYEFLPWLLSGAGILILLRGIFTIPGWAPVPSADLPAALRAAEEERAATSQPAGEPEPHPGGESLHPVAASPNGAAVLFQGSALRIIFLLFTSWWVIGAWIAFTVAGEKMPWLLTHIALPMCVMGGWTLGWVIGRVDWPAAVRTRAFWLIGVAPALILALAVLVWGGPAGDRSLVSLSTTLQWVLGIALVAGLGYLGWRWGEAVGWHSGLRLLALGVVVVLFLLTVRTSYRLTFINYDMATEYLVYAHASPDIKLALNEIDAISERTVGGRNIVVAYDDESSWPLSWYMRQYPNAKFYGASPSSDSMSAPVVIVGPKNYEKVHPYVMRDYVKRTYRLIWWPDMGYFNLTWGDVWRGITDPVQRKRNWLIFFYRRFEDVTPEGTLGKERDLSQWPHRHEFEMWVRRDLAAQIWNLGVAPLAVSTNTLDAQA
ncbi:MAG TPA: glycosyltransferase family 39 protein, partial [Caldilineaceae bacterium]|nr:glycosyltransferase family 39 protein [Caldilineaceae bacterium]